MGVVEKKHGRTDVPERDPFTRVFFSALTRRMEESRRERIYHISDQQNQKQLHFITI